MPYHDLSIEDQSFPSFRGDLNSALKALGSTLSGSIEPSPTYIGMLWYDSPNNILKMRNEGNDQWISMGYFDQNTDTFRLLDGTLLVDTLGVETGLLGTQATNVWQTGTGTTESLVSPAKLKAATQGTSSLSESGYQTFPSGLYMQWGRVTGVNAAQNKTVTLPIAFPNNFWVVNATPMDNRASGDFEVDFYSVACLPVNLSTFTIINEGTSSGNNQTMMYQAIGN
tara:strand:- start:2297 stop:2974 length:678 start_codon:yes stop_codon:yes gene_type:complete